MHPNQAAVTMLFKALEERDPARLDAALHEEVRYTGPLFGELVGFRVHAMWQLLFTRPRLAVSVTDMKVTPMQGTVVWQMSYAAGKKSTVLDTVTSRVEFRDDRIHTHSDTFSMFRHAVGAFGLKGWALGWLPPVHGSMRNDALSQLSDFIDQHNLSSSNRLAPPPPKKRRSGLPDVNVEWDRGKKANLR